MAKQINIGVVANDSEVAIPPTGMTAFYWKLVGGNLLMFSKDDAGTINSIVPGVNDIVGLTGSVTKQALLDELGLENFTKLSLTANQTHAGPSFNVLEQIGDFAIDLPIGSHVVDFEYIMSQPRVSTTYDFRLGFRTDQQGTNTLSANSRTSGRIFSHSNTDSTVTPSNNANIGNIRNNTTNLLSHKSRIKGWLMVNASEPITLRPSFCIENNSAIYIPTLHVGSFIKHKPV